MQPIHRLKLLSDTYRVHSCTVFGNLPQGTAKEKGRSSHATSRYLPSGDGETAV